MENNAQNIQLLKDAKQLLMNNWGMSEHQAHRNIQKLAMNSCISKYLVARMIVDGCFNFTFDIQKEDDL